MDGFCLFHPCDDGHNMIHKIGCAYLVRITIFGDEIEKCGGRGFSNGTVDRKVAGRPNLKLQFVT